MRISKSNPAVDNKYPLVVQLLAERQRHFTLTSAGYQRPFGLNMYSQNLFSSVIKIYCVIKYPTKEVLSSYRNNRNIRHLFVYNFYVVDTWGNKSPALCPSENTINLFYCKYLFVFLEIFSCMLVVSNTVPLTLCTNKLK